MFRKKHISIMFFVHAFLSYGQPEKNLRPEFLISAGYSYNFIWQNTRNDLQNGAYGLNCGVYSKRSLDRKLEIWFGIVYNYKWMNSYKNRVIYMPWQVPVELNTSISQHFFELPFMLKLRLLNRLSMGAGLVFSYLIASDVSQETNSVLDSTWKTEVIRSFYRIKKGYYNYENSPFTKINIAPLINVGFVLNKRITIEYIASIDLVANPRIWDKINTYNIVGNNFLVTFKLN